MAAAAALNYLRISNEYMKRSFFLGDHFADPGRTGGGHRSAHPVILRLWRGARVPVPFWRLRRLAHGGRLEYGAHKGPGHNVHRCDQYEGTESVDR